MWGYPLGKKEVVLSNFLMYNEELKRKVKYLHWRSL